MNLPKIDISALPNLDQLTGMFGSLHHQIQAQSDDTIVIMMTFIWDLLEPSKT